MMNNKFAWVLFMSMVVVSFGAPPAPGEVRNWTVQQVKEWVLTAGFPEIGTAQTAVVENEVTGKILLMVDDDDLQHEFGMSGGLKRKQILVAIQELKDAADKKYGKDGDHKLTFMEYRSMDYFHLFQWAWYPPRLQTDLSSFPPQARPADAIGWISWLLWPEWYLFRNADDILGGLPGCLTYVYLAHFVLKFVCILTGNLGSVLIIEFFIPVAMYLVVNSFMCTSFPFVPSFLCNMLLVCAIYIFPICLWVAYACICLPESAKIKELLPFEVQAALAECEVQRRALWPIFQAGNARPASVPPPYDAAGDAVPPPYGAR